MKRSEEDRLLQEMLAGEELADFRQSSLEEGLVKIRRQRRHRRAVRIGAVASLPCLLALTIVLSRTTDRQRILPPQVAALPAPPSPKADVKFITDEDLFALFPNRSMALIGKPGQQQLVFLDRRASSRQP